MLNESKLPSRAWLIVGLLWMVGCLNYLDRVLVTTMRGSLVAAIPMTEAQFGLLTSVFLWVYALLSPFAGFLADRFNRSRVIICSLFAWSVITWLTAHATTFPQLLATRALMGISEACYIPAALALIADYHRGPTRSLATGIHMSGIMVGSALGGFGGWIAERHGWNHAFLLFGLAGIAYTGVIALLLRDLPAEAPAAGAMAVRVDMRAALKSLFGRTSFILALFYWGLLGLAGWAVVGWMPTYLNEHFHLSQGTAGLSATGYLQTAALIGVLVGGVWADHWSRKDERGRVLVPLIGLLVAAPGILLASSIDWLPLAIAGLILFGLAKAFADTNMMPILCSVADPRYRATGYGLLNFFSCAVGGLTIYAGGVLRDADVNVGRVFQFAAASLLVCAVLLYFIRPQSASNR
ncbi:MFS transporter [Opitutus sp. GAS368]|uniref:MFS transporter n=1 Tax=Opitutus sp. GAS368 TaxID=1882749 RepID=UPI000B890076|nr:MFS transporter [Opitutus sp. GAS368]